MRPGDDLTALLRVGLRRLKRVLNTDPGVILARVEIF
jgi:hypothetical protein